jgi:hypothetical protein
MPLRLNRWNGYPLAWSSTTKYLSARWSTWDHRMPDCPRQDSPIQIVSHDLHCTRGSSNLCSRATQFGTSWYHSHWSAQYGDGVVGTMIIDGPASSNYDVDLGTLPLTDWYYTPAFTLNEVAQHSTKGPPAPDNFLVNGTHVSGTGSGSYAKINVAKVRMQPLVTIV